MSNRKRTTIYNIVFKYFQLGFSLISGLVLLPIYLKFITIEQYGALLAITSVVVWFSIIDPGIANILTQKVGSSLGGKEQRYIIGYINAGLICSLIIAVGVSVAGIVLSGYVVELLQITQDKETFQNIFIISSFNVAIMIVGYTFVGINYGFQSTISVGSFFLTSTVIKIVIVLILLYSGTGVISIVYSDFAASLVVLMGGLIIISSNIKREGLQFKLETNGMKEMLALFSLSFGARLSKLVVRSLDNIYIARILGTGYVALYSVTATAPRKSEDLINMPSSAFRPALSHLAGSQNIEKIREIILRLTRVSIWSMALLFVCVLSLNEGFVTLWVGKELFAGNNVSTVLCIVFLLHIWTNVWGLTSFSLGHIKRNSIMEVISSLIMIPALYLGAKHHGLMGIVIAHITVMLLTTAWYYPILIVQSRHITKSELKELAKVFGSVAFAVSISIILFGRQEVVSWSNFVSSLLLLSATYIAVLALICSSFRKEVSYLSKWCRKCSSNISIKN